MVCCLLLGNCLGEIVIFSLLKLEKSEFVRRMKIEPASYFDFVSVLKLDSAVSQFLQRETVLSSLQGLIRSQKVIEREIILVCSSLLPGGPASLKLAREAGLRFGSKV